MKPYVEVKYEYLYGCTKKKKKNPIISISTTVIKMINNTDKGVSPKNEKKKKTLKNNQIVY